ncbi:MAG: energy-coupling factor transporter transmembrane component T family protein [Alphaproteobacteria bacterium]
MISPFSKLVFTVSYLITAAGLKPDALTAACVFAFFPAVSLVKIKIPARLCIPVMTPVFCLAAGNLFFAPPVFTAVLLLKAAAYCLTALIFASTTRIEDVLAVFNTLKCPRFFIFQLFFICRYLDLILYEAVNLKRAFQLRSRRNIPKIGEWKYLAGNLLLRCLDRADRIHQAMNCRNFNLQTASFPSARIGFKDVAVSLCFVFFCQMLRKELL